MTLNTNADQPFNNNTKWIFMSRLTNLLRIFLLSTFILLTPICVMADQKPTVGSFEDWDNLDKVEIKQLFKLEDYATVTVEPFETKDVELPEQDDNTFKPVVEARDAFSQRIFESIKDELENKPVNNTINKELGKVLLVRGKVLIMNPGVKSLRMFVGVGAGHGGVEIQSELVDQETNTVLATLIQKRLSGGGWLGGSYDGMLEDLTEELGEDVASLIAHFR
jgi:hypothetical protein